MCCGGGWVQELIRSGAEYKPKRLGWQAFVNMMKIKTNLLLITQVRLPQQQTR